jgi:septal ring factor EnvC (AmiA/AmiB activator)
MMRRSRSRVGLMAVVSTTTVIAAAVAVRDHGPQRFARRTRVVALAWLLTFVCLPGVAHAQTAPDPLTALRASIDATAQRWFDAHNEAASLDTRIAGLEERIKGMELRVAVARKVATARAVVLYKGTSLAYANVFGTTVIESARRAELIDRANVQNMSAIEDFTAALKELRSNRDDLDRSRAGLDKALQVIAAQRDALDTQLASLQKHTAQPSRAADTTLNRHRHGASPLVSAPATAAPTAPVPAASVDPPPTISPPPGGRASPRHNDPFLVCTRRIESRGNYGVVSADGIYYGAYQFLPSTWNATAAYAGRMDLVGVVPSNASPYDQDEMAWALYTWQGKSPWGGRC